jgi:hypothetical protein
VTSCVATSLGPRRRASISILELLAVSPNQLAVGFIVVRIEGGAERAQEGGSPLKLEG